MHVHNTKIYRKETHIEDTNIVINFTIMTKNVDRSKMKRPMVQ